MTMKVAYNRAVASQGLDTDVAQQRVVERLDALQRVLVQNDALFHRMRRRLPGKLGDKSPRGMYLWGGVGRGKTFLMDLFFNSLDIDAKKRIHFHRMMSDVHARLHAISHVEDPLDQVADDIANEIDMLCFDEFFVSDIADAMILGRLLHGLFSRGITLVATSNAHPNDLYPDGLQRQQFLPAIEALGTHTEIVELDAGTDYRLRLFAEAGTFITPNDETATGKLKRYFDGIASSEVRPAHNIDILGRPIKTVYCAKGVAWFDFFAICDGPRSQEDYIEIARWYPTIVISDLPVLDSRLDNAARRFIALVDEFYDRRVKLVISAATSIDQIYQGERLAFEFQRTTSRLTEMQGEEYLHAAHLA